MGASCGGADAPQDPWKESSLRLFVANKLNFVGWSALVAGTVVASVVAGLAAQALDLPVPVLAIAGAALVLALVLAADRRYFRSMYTGYSRWTSLEASEGVRDWLLDCAVWGMT
jgi:hypothetical protein